MEQGSHLLNRGAVEDGELAHGACGREVLIEGVTQAFPSTIRTKDLKMAVQWSCVAAYAPGCWSARNASVFAARRKVKLKHVASSVKDKMTSATSSGHWADPHASV